MGSDSYLKIFELENGTKIKLELRDTNGQMKFRPLTKIITMESKPDCIVIGFDITMEYTFVEVKKYWYPTVKRILKTNLIYLIGNKIECQYEGVLSLEARDFAKENNLRYFEVSCRTGKGIDKFLEDLKNEIIKL